MGSEGLRAEHPRSPCANEAAATSPRPRGCCCCCSWGRGQEGGRESQRDPRMESAPCRPCTPCSNMHACANRRLRSPLLHAGHILSCSPLRCGCSLRSAWVCMRMLPCRAPPHQAGAHPELSKRGLAGQLLGAEIPDAAVQLQSLRGNIIVRQRTGPLVRSDAGGCTLEICKGSSSSRCAPERRAAASLLRGGTGSDAAFRRGQQRDADLDKRVRRYLR